MESNKLKKFKDLEIAIVGCVLHLSDNIDLVTLSLCTTIYNCKYKPFGKNKKLFLDEREKIEPGDIVTIIKKDICKRGYLLDTDKEFSKSIDMRIKGINKLLRIKVSNDNIYLTGGKVLEDLDLVITVFDHMKWCSNCLEYLKSNYEVFIYFTETLYEKDDILFSNLKYKDFPLNSDNDIKVDRNDVIIYLLDFIHEFTKISFFTDYFNELISVPTCAITKDITFSKWNKSMQNYWFDIGKKLNRYKLQEIFDKHPKFNSSFETSLSPSCMIYFPYENKNGKKGKVYSVSFTVKSTGKISLSGQDDEKSEEAYNLFCEIITKNNHLIRY